MVDICNVLTLEDVVNNNLTKKILIVRPSCAQDYIKVLTHYKEQFDANPPMLTMNQIELIMGLMGYERRTK
ncbi:MAG: hypothetical protein J6T10_22255 [Methanobrevibacter sp.]|nr:hypothetical protein [Methanobrevibacter sp.]